VDEDGLFFYRIWGDDGKTATLMPADMFHLRGMGNEYVGYSIVMLAAESIGLGLAQQEFTAKFFGEGTIIAGVYTYPGKLSPTDRKTLEETWPKGRPNMHKALFLENGMKWEPAGQTAKDAQLIEAMSASSIDVARWMRMPPHKIGILDRATFSNIEEQNIDYVTDTLDTWVTLMNQEADRKLLTPAERFNPDGGLFCRMVLLSRLRGDAESRSAYYSSRFHIGSLSPNDIRELEDENPIEGGDTYFVQPGVVPIDTVREMAEMQLTAPPGPQPPDDDDGDDDEDEPETGGGDESTLVAAVTDGNGPDLLTQQPQPQVIQVDATHMQDSLAPIYRDSAARILAKEAKALDRAAKKYAGNPDGFHKWADQFTKEHIQWILDVVTPSCEAYARSLRKNGCLSLHAELATKSVELTGKLMTAARERYAEGRMDGYVAAMQSERIDDIVTTFMEAVEKWQL
jgi:HK97 family phage portal protein